VTDYIIQHELIRFPLPEFGIIEFCVSTFLDVEVLIVLLKLRFEDVQGIISTGRASLPVNHDPQMGVVSPTASCANTCPNSIPELGILSRSLTVLSAALFVLTRAG
jgi:hypothetical protein